MFDIHTSLENSITVRLTFQEDHSASSEENRL